jgi:hypothetical protein
LRELLASLQRPGFLDLQALRGPSSSLALTPVKRTSDFSMMVGGPGSTLTTTLRGASSSGVSVSSTVTVGLK